MNPAQLDNNPRKLPRQERSKQTVAAIMESTAQILIRHGYEGTTTARIAERAGTSIGSIYQYFPNREALVASLAEQHAMEILASIRGAVAETTHATLTDGLVALVRATAAAHLANPRLHKVLSEQVPIVGKHGVALQVHRQAANYIEALLREHADETAFDLDVTVASVVIETTLEALVHKAVIDSAELLAGDVLEQQLLQLITGYLGVGRR